VVQISHKPSFPSAHQLQFTMSASGAFGLKFSSKLSVLGSDVLHGFAVKEHVAGAYCDVVYATVDSKNLDIANYCWIRRLNGYMEIEISSIRERATSHAPSEIQLIVIGNEEGCLNPAVGRCYGSYAVKHVNRDNALVIPHGSERLPVWYRITFQGFERLTSTVSRSLHKADRKLTGFPDNAVRCLVVLNLVPSVAIKATLSRGVERLRIFSHGIEKLRSILSGYSKLECETTYHIHTIRLLEGISFDWRCIVC